MSKNFMKKTLAGIFALAIVASSTPIAPFVPVMNSNSITASAETAPETDFEFDASSGTITGYTGTGGDVEIPSKIGGVAVTSIGDYAFQRCYNLTSVTIPKGVTSISNYAFYNCYDLTSVTIPEGVTSIGESAFDSCASLVSVTIPEGVTSIGDDAFLECSNLTSVTIPESVTSIGDFAFAYCSNLASVTIPEGVTSIGGYAFYVCKNLASVTIPESVTSIGDFAFAGCTSLTSITAPCTLENSMSDAMGNSTATITYTHPCTKSTEYIYKVKCACGDTDLDYTDVFVLLANEDDFLKNVNSNDYTEDSWNALYDSVTALTEIVSDFAENVFVSAQSELTAAISAYNDAKDALEEKPQYDTLYECYLVTAPTVTETGTYNKRAYHYEGDAKVVDNETVFDTAKEVSFEQWYLRTLIQYQTDGTTFDLRFVSMLDENLDQYQKAGFIFTINGTAVSDELSTVTANTSYIVDNEEVNISAFSEDNDYFFLQNYVFDIGEIDLDASLAVTAYIVLADGTKLQGTKAVTFTLRQFEG